MLGGKCAAGPVRPARLHGVAIRLRTVTDSAAKDSAAGVTAGPRRCGRHGSDSSVWTARGRRGCGQLGWGQLGWGQLGCGQLWCGQLRCGRRRCGYRAAHVHTGESPVDGIQVRGGGGRRRAHDDGMRRVGRRNGEVRGRFNGCGFVGWGFVRCPCVHSRSGRRRRDRPGDGRLPRGGVQRCGVGRRIAWHRRLALPTGRRRPWFFAGRQVDS